MHPDLFQQLSPRITRCGEMLPHQEDGRCPCVNSPTGKIAHLSVSCRCLRDP